MSTFVYGKEPDEMQHNTAFHQAQRLTLFAKI